MTSLLYIYEDDHLLVVHKPCGLLAHPSGTPGQQNMVSLLQEDKNNPEIRPVHRLDRHTSGLMVYAKTLQSARYLGQVFQARQVEKEYIAQVRGLFSNPSGQMNGDLGTDLSSEVKIKRKVVEQGTGEAATTHFEILKHQENTTLVKLFPLTGRRHQLRVHLKNEGHPIVNDPIYDLGDDYYLSLRSSNLITPPMHLCATKMTLPLQTGEKKTFTLPTPEDWFSLTDLENS